MATKFDVVAQVRFQLDQLSARNGHHEFEHLCRSLTRERICANVLPATGPVSAGGDQGRDFETFRSYLQTTALADAAFIGNVSNEHIVFACTLTETSRLAGKILTDVGTIMSGGLRPERIYVFAASDLPVGKRHELQETVRTTHQVELEIIDGQGLSELLADPEVFWIAEKFLSIPSTILPRSKDSGWYEDALARWSAVTAPSYSFAEYSEIRRATRHAVFESKNKQDLTLWLRLLDDFTQHGPFPALRVTARATAS